MDQVFLQCFGVVRGVCVCLCVVGGRGLEVEQSQLTNLVVFKHRHDEGRMWFTMMKPREMLCMQLQINV